MTKSELDIIKLALTQVVRARVEKVESLPPAPFSTSVSFNDAMNNFINGRKELRLRKIQIRKAVAIAIIAALVLSFAACCIIYREEIKGFFVEIYDKHGKLSNVKNNTDLDIELYKPQCIPENYVLSETSQGICFIQSIWTNETKNIILTQSPDIKSEVLIDTEDKSYSSFILDDINLYYTHNNETTLIIWRQYNSIFKLNCPNDISWDEIEKFILSFDLVE